MRQQIGRRLAMLVLLLAGWQVVSVLSHGLLPGIPAILGTVGDILTREQSTVLVSGGVWTHLSSTLYRIAVGFGGAMIVGIILGILMGVSRYAERFFVDYVTVGMSLPSLFVAVLAAMWYGISPTTAFVATGIVSFPFIANNMYEGVKTLDRSLVQMASTYNISRRRVITEVVIPAIMPFFFAALRYGFAMAWKIATLVELFAATHGVGYMISSAFKRESLAEVIAWTFLFTAFILLVEYLIFQPIERRVFRWRPDAQLSVARG